MWHPGLIGGTVIVASAAVYLLGPSAAGAVAGTAAWATGGGIGVIIGSTPELIDGFNTGRNASDIQAPGAGPLQPVPDPTEEPL